MRRQTAYTLNLQVCKQSWDAMLRPIKQGNSHLCPSTHADAESGGLAGNANNPILQQVPMLCAHAW